MKLITVLLLSIATHSLDIINSDYLTLTNPPTYYCQLLSQDFTATVNIAAAVASVKVATIPQYFGNSLKIVFNHISIPNTDTAFWKFNGTNRSYTGSDTWNNAPIVNKTYWVFNTSVSFKARAIPTDSSFVAFYFTSAATGKNMMIKKDLKLNVSPFTITSASISPTINGSDTCLTLNFTTNCSSLEEDTAFEFVSPNFNGTTTHMFSNLDSACQDDVTFPYKNAPDCTVSSTGVLISRMYGSLTANTQFSAKICSLIAPPSGSAYPVTLNLVTSTGLKYASTSFSVTST